MRYWIALFITLFTLSGCARLDDNLFNPEKVSSYAFEDYRGERELVVPENYNIDPAKIKVFTLKSGKGGEITNIAAVFVGNESDFTDPNYRVIVYCHGNKHHIDLYWNRIKLLANVGEKYQFGVLTVDYRGYGLSEGEPTETGLYEDVDAAFQWLKDQGFTGDRLILYGYSLGSAPAVELAVNTYSLNPTKVILEAPFASSAVMVQDATLLSLPPSYVTDVKINNADKIKTMTQPLLWFHGIADEFIAIKTHGEVLFANHPGEENVTKFANRVAEAKHNNLPQVIADQNGGYDYYLNTILEFIE